jgi:5-methylcytosine-specific restriction endonuclease McrA
MLGSSTLCLNASYEPLGIISMERAVTLVVLDRATMIKGTGRFISSPSISIERPSVIVMNRMVKTQRGKMPVPLSRKALFSRDGGKCAFCGDPGDTIDHVQPRSKGGKHTWSNVVTACVRCNSIKADRTPEEADMPLRYKPFEPTRQGMILARRRPEWEEYLS